jgi:hypothetical protein
MIKMSTLMGAAHFSRDISVTFDYIAYKIIPKAAIFMGSRFPVIGKTIHIRRKNALMISLFSPLLNNLFWTP